MKQKKRQSKEILALKNKIEEMGGWISEGLRDERPEVMDRDTEQTFIAFPNGYGASIVRGYGSFGFEQNLFELAFIKIYSETPHDWEFVERDREAYIIGWLTPRDILDELDRISMMANRQQ